MKELLTNATVVDDAIRFVYQKSKDKLKPSANDSEYDKEESNELNYDEDQDQLEEQEEETGEMTTTTVVDLAEKAKANGLKIQCLTFKDLKKRVSLEIAQQQSRLFERLQDKPFWIEIEILSH